MAKQSDESTKQTPTWAEKITVHEIVALLRDTFRNKYSKEMTPRARRRWREEIEKQLVSMPDDVRFATGTNSPEEAVEKLADLTAGSLDVKTSEVNEVPPFPSINSLAGHHKVSVAVSDQTFKKANAYYEKTRLCPAWPFCH